MILFASETYGSMAAALEKSAGVLHGKFYADRFENGELHVEVRTSVARQHCLILGSIAPPDGQLLSVLLLAHTLKKEGARWVTAILPYLAYARHDKEKPGESLATAWVAELAQASGIDQVTAVDAHSERARALFSIPVTSLSPAEIFAEALIGCGLTGATIVAPDEGAIARCQAVRAAAGLAAAEALPSSPIQKILPSINSRCFVPNSAAGPMFKDSARCCAFTHLGKRLWVSASQRTVRGPTLGKSAAGRPAFLQYFLHALFNDSQSSIRSVIPCRPRASWRRFSKRCPCSTASARSRSRSATGFSASRRAISASILADCSRHLASASATWAAQSASVFASPLKTG